ncbi:hypothetical protein HF086_008430 [Spodoptera exigua]|uniref:Alpha-glucosidase n=1 Tax=Spodoptera exigua TaxID=7107 RepID=A0A922MPJ9_SPOEX|nr:hypothetical protein HF086_008430 [Spodoptera exigua]
MATGVTLALCAVPPVDQRRPHVHMNDDGSYFLTNDGPSGPHYVGHIGRGAVQGKDNGVKFDLQSSGETWRGGLKISITWTGPADVVFQDCIDFGNSQWFAGPEQKQQYWPIQNSFLKKYSAVSKEEDNAAVGERYWLNSDGMYIYVAPEVPLFIDYHNELENHLCLIAEVADPYSTRRTENVLKYDLWFFENPKIAHQHAVDNYLGKPSGIPDYRMIQYPIWSTWARYSREIDQENLWAFANEIKDSGFPNAQFEIDDLWEVCYGSLFVDVRKLPDLKQLVQDIKGLGFRVAIWVHPFINKDCEPWYSEALGKGYLVLNEEGSPDTTWWNNNGSIPGYIDFTNPEAADWFSDRVRNVIETYDIDTVKFDAGESSWSPQVVQNGLDINLHPGHIVQAYVRTVAKFGPAIEVRSGMRTQDLPVFIRMVDKDTLWDYNNGLETLITTLLSMNLNGYTLVLPDMIGGNGYNEKPSKELFIRWLQANVFMPTLQYSFVPWDHDDENFQKTTQAISDQILFFSSPGCEISRRYTDLHAEFADVIVAAMEKSVSDGTPVNPPIWWLDPHDEEAFPIADVFLTLGARAHTAAITEAPSVRADDVTLTLEPILTGGFHLVLTNVVASKSNNKINQSNITPSRQTNIQTSSKIGRTLVAPFTVTDVDGGLLVRIGNVNLTINTLYEAATQARGIKFSWEADQYTRLEDCIDFGTKHWYAGPMQVDQLYPVETATQVYRPSYIQETDNGAIMERYWLNSVGEYIIVHDKVPLFVDYKNILNNHLCFGAQLAGPYSTNRPRTILAYDMWFLSDVKAAHKHAIANYLGKPSGTPDFQMVQHPIWSTWAQYSREINETKLLDFAQQIRDNGFNNSQFEIDDQWETCYGSLVVNEEKFPDFKQTVQDLKDMGYRVTIWAHPFINRNCDPWFSEAVERGFFVMDESLSTNTSWWNNNGTNAGYIDFTNPKAADWYHDRLKDVLDTYGIDSVAIQTGEIEFQPHHLVQQYAKICADFGNMVEVRAGFRTQDLPIYVRMVDRDSIWGLNNGLATVITTTFQMNLNGYPFVLPDMIGGNGYNLDHEQADLPTKELFIRWVQANTFLPVMQFSFAPWNFDEETVQISKKYTDLHAEYADVIFEAMEAAVDDGTPVNTPLWWIAPHDEEALVIWDEYLLAETVLVAPVLTEGARSRDIYLPAGVWYEEGDLEKPIEGPTWIRNYPAPLDVLPYFVRDKSVSHDSMVFAALVACAQALNQTIFDVAGSKAVFLTDGDGGFRIVLQRGTHHWYGGPQQKEQYWPIQNLNFSEYSYVTKEADNCGVAERYWLNSAGLFYYFDKKVPLFVDSKNLVNNSACFIAKVQPPYSSKRTRNYLIYDIAIFEDVRKAHEYAVEKYLKKPTGYPDELMIKYPIWSTWARYKRDVNNIVVLEFADEITKHGFPNSQFELDDLWEICYGSLTVNTTRFPSMKDTIATLRQKGYRTTMWAHPFLNKGCEPWYTNAKNLGYIVSSETGNVDTSWWNNNGTIGSYIDFSKEVVRKWYMDRLMRLQNETGVAVLQGDIYEHPNIITTDYVRTVAAFGSLVEVRVGFGTQDLPIFVRMIDKDTYWDFRNGLATLITTLFQMNINGYPLVLPDMIGGNGYNEAPSRELFVRWLQANTFMPSLQFSYVPWDYDEEIVNISKKFVNLHAEYAPAIIAACKKAILRKLREICKCDGNEQRLLIKLVLLLSGDNATNMSALLINLITSLRTPVGLCPADKMLVFGNLAFAALVAWAHAIDICILDSPNVKAEIENNPLGGYNIVLDRRGLSEVIAVVGRRTGAIKDVVEDGDVVIQFSNDTTVRISSEEVVGERNGYIITFTWEAPKGVSLEDCVNLDQNNLEKNAACFIAQIKSPYSNKRAKTDLIYAIGIFDDARKAHEYAVEKYLEKPKGIPDERMITYPIWSTWARYKRDVNHNTVLQFADEITKNGFPNSQLEIDDLWETCYGSQTVDVARFPNIRNTMAILRAKGYRVTLWTHPFINKGCEPWYSEAKSKGYLVASEYGSVETSWWNDNDTTTAYIDFTKPAARQWYLDRLHLLKNTSGVDSFKFDGGESSWSPQVSVISADYVRTVAQFGPLVEVRVGYR